MDVTLSNSYKAISWLYALFQTVPTNWTILVFSPKFSWQSSNLPPCIYPRLREGSDIFFFVDYKRIWTPFRQNEDVTVDVLAIRNKLKIILWSAVSDDEIIIKSTRVSTLRNDWTSCINLFYLFIFYIMLFFINFCCFALSSSAILQCFGSFVSV